MLLAAKVLVGFLRGLLTNLGTPPVTSDIRSILVRPLLSEMRLSEQITWTFSLFVVLSRRQAPSFPTLIENFVSGSLVVKAN